MSVTRPAPERDTTGPRGTYGCACTHTDPWTCAYRGCGYSTIADAGQHCDCLCHVWPDEDDDLDTCGG